MAYIYLLHFDRPISDNHTTQHYVGSANEINERIRQHQEGYGCRLTQVARERQNGFTVVRIWMGNRRWEQRLKQLKCSPKFCPMCNPKNTWDLLHSDHRPLREIKHLHKKLGDLVSCN